MGYFKKRTSDAVLISTGNSKDGNLSARSNTNKSLNKSNISSSPSTQTYQIIKTFSFTSDRKAMSVIARRPDGKVFIYVKGADSSLLGMSDGQGVDDL